MNLNYNFLNTRLGSLFSGRKLEQDGLSNAPSSRLTTFSWLGSLALLLSLLIGQTGMAQVASYTFSQSSGTYTPIAGGTVIRSGSALDSGGATVTLPTAFNYNGSSVTQVHVKDDGYIALGVSSFSSTAPISSSTTATGIIAALACDLMDATASGSVPEIRWEQIGNEIIFQWNDFARYTTSATTEVFDFQIRLNTSNGVINIIYSNFSTTNTSTTYIPQVGLRGSSNTDYNARRLTTSVPDAVPAWDDTAAATSNAHNVRFTSTSPAAFPTAGQTFTWTPLVLSPCTTPAALPSAMLFSSVTTTSLSGSFTAAAPAPSKYLVVRSTSATPPTPANGTVYTVGATTLGAGTNVRLASNATTFTDSGLTAGTQYYYHVFSYNDLCTGQPFYSATALTAGQATVCASATSVATNTITTNSANVTWTGSGNYIVEYGLTGFTPGTGATNGIGGTIASSTATSPFALSGLVGSTGYSVYVRQVCPLGGYSSNSTVSSFTTACEAITVFPSTFDFASYLPSVCWKEGDLGDLTVGPTTIGGSSVSDWLVDGFLNDGSIGAAKMNIDAATGSEWLISPFYTIPTTSYRVKYSVGATNWAATTVVTNWEADDFVELLVSTSNTNWTVLKTYNASNVPSHLGQIDEALLAAYSGQTVQFAFRAFEGASNGSADIDFFIDNFVVETLPVLPPDCATGLIPADLATNVVRNSSFTWSAATGSPTSYDVYLGTSTNPSFVANVTSLSYTPSVMSANTTYYWKVVPKNNNGDAVGCVEQSFATGTTILYCPSVPTSNDASGITQVVLGSTSVTIPDVMYQDNTATTVSVNQGAELNTQITFATGYTYNTNIWIDFNDNGSFTDSGELVFSGESLATNPTTFNASFTMPMSAALGAHRMRIGTADSGQLIPNPCYSGSFGVTLDFTVQVNAMPTDTPDWVNLQWPYSATILAGNSETIYARVYEGGLTDTTSGQAAGIEAWIGISPIGSDSNPNTWSTWIPATFNVEVGNNDEYQANIGSTLPVGTYYYASRFRLNGGPFVYGGTNDYFWNGTGNNSGVLTVDANPTQCAVIGAPANAATNVTIGTVALSWTAPTSGPAPTGYKVYFGTTSGSLTLMTTTNASTFTYNATAPSYSTTYYWSVVPTSVIGGGDAVGCAEWSFTTEADPFAPYCSGITFTSAVEPITLVNFAGINNATGATVGGTPAHQNFIAMSGNVTTESTYAITLKGNSDGDYTNNFRVFIDWNQDGDFGDSGETFNAGSITNSTGLDAIQAVTNITIPGSALAGTTRMRVKKLFGTTSIDNPCLGGGFGQVEDYTLNVTLCTPLNWYADNDGDTYGDNSTLVSACSSPGANYVLVGGDCNDNNIAINPGATEICYDGIDQNCDGNLMNSCAVITAQLRAENCGSTLTTLNQVVRGSLLSQSLPSGVTITGYRFRVTNLLTNEVRIVDRSNYVFQLSYTDFAEYNTPYSVEVAVRLNQQWMDTYGAPCTITTPDVPNTVLAATSCGATLAQMNNIIRAVVVPSALQYEFEVSLIEGAVAVETTNLIKTGESFNLLQLSGISIKFGAEYSVRVKVQVPTASGPQWSTVYGAPCSVFTPLAVEAAIEGCGLETGIAPAAMTTLIYATPVGGATQYKFTLTDGMAYTQTYTTPSRYFKLSNFNALQALTPGGTYSVTVEVQVYGFYYPGKDCNILVPGGAPIVPFTRAVVGTDNVMGEFKAVAYPNPFENSFELDLRTSSTSPVTLAIYDMTGRLLDTKEIKAEGLSTQTIGERYPSGVYNVIVTQGENMQTVRVVKK